jgi:malate dehydrogenase (quinone)
MKGASFVPSPDVVLIGSGIMSAHLGALLKELDPRLRMQVFESAPTLAPESSHGWHNAGTGHAGLCELSYTPTQEPDGTVPVGKALEIFGQFEQSKQFWTHAVAHGMTGPVRSFLRPVPHISFVHGEPYVRFLRARYEGLKAHHFFEDMEFTTDPKTIGSWAPLLLDGRDQFPIAATRVLGGTDIDFGSLARQLMAWLGRQPGCAVATGSRVTGLEKSPAGWNVTVADGDSGELTMVSTRFVFVGAGGGSLPLLQAAGLPEARGLGGFPIGGQWLVCDEPSVVGRHHAKVYGQPQPEAPTMAVPHLDTRVLDGRKSLLFGPFAAWTTRFLHRGGSVLDLPRSIRSHNLATLVRIGLSNMELVRYLIDQGTQTMESRVRTLQQFYPAAREEDWHLRDAGIRVQAIKKTDGEAGIVHYGTEVITSADRSLCSLLGASPGASVCVAIALEVIEKCFSPLLQAPESRARLETMVPGRLQDVSHADQAARHRVWTARCTEVLELAR